MDKCPILVDVANPELMSDVRTVAAVTHRTMAMVDTEDAIAAVEKVLNGATDLGKCGGNVGILITDQPNRLETHQRLKVIREADLGRSPEFGQVLDLARQVGMQDHPLIAVHAAVGGAGASVMSVCLAQALTDRGRPAILIDAHPHSLGLDIALGVESATTMTVRSPLAGLGYADIARQAGRVGQIPLLPIPAYPHPGQDQEPGALLDRLAVALTESCAVVDCGTARAGSAEYQHIIGAAQVDFHVVVTTNTVAGLMQARMAAERIDQLHSVQPLVVVRTKSKSELPQAMASVMLQQYPVVRVYTDPQVASNLDKGTPEEFLHDGHHLVRTAHGLLGQWEAENLLIFDELVQAAAADVEVCPESPAS